MPTVLREGPYRYFFYSGDRDDPPHVHIERDRDTAKYWLDPVRLQSTRDFNSRELNKLQGLVEKHQIELLERWHEFFAG